MVESEKRKSEAKLRAAAHRDSDGHVAGDVDGANRVLDLSRRAQRHQICIGNRICYQICENQNSLKFPKPSNLLMIKFIFFNSLLSRRATSMTLEGCAPPAPPSVRAHWKRGPSLIRDGPFE